MFNKKSRFLAAIIGFVILLLIVGIIGYQMYGSATPIKNPLNYEVQNFQFHNQDGKSVSLEDLKGDVWLANFIFTNCETVCPPMTANMSKIQKMIKEEGLKAKIISFSVDPEVDTPDKIKEFTKPYDITFDNWSFLTGYKQEEIEKYASKSFKALVKKPENSDQVIHGTNFYLIDQNGKVMKDYIGSNADTPYEEIISDIKALENSK